MELDPRIILIMDARAQVGCEIAPFPRVCSSRLDILGKANEERSKDGDGTKDDDEPHLRQNPCVQLPDEVGYVLRLRNEGDCDGLVDAGYTCSKTKMVSQPYCSWRSRKMSTYISPPPMMRHRLILSDSFICCSRPTILIG